jgi:arylsulfatase A-like enzyme
MLKKIVYPVLTLAVVAQGCTSKQNERKPNVIIIYTDDVGYGDIGCYGSDEVSTPNIDRLADEGVRFTNAYACASTCTPSRYALLTGEYHWRKPPGWSVGKIKGVSIAPGDAGILIDPAKPTLPSLLKGSGYKTAVVGKWHVGLGPEGGPDWNGTIKPGMPEIGFDYSFIIPVTGDRVPCVFVENSRVAGLDPDDPIQISYKKPIGPDSLIYNPDITPDIIVSYDKPADTGRQDKRGIKMHPSFGHDQSIINGIPRIGYMTGGRSALWKDEEIAETITEKALSFLDDNRDNPFFLYFSTHDVHVPRVPGKRFAGKSSLGVYGDVIMQMDWCVGQIIDRLDKLGLAENTLVIFSSDNGPVQNDGYHDGTDEISAVHKPSGPYRGGKYSALEGGTKVPFIVRWTGKIKPEVSDVLFSQIDIMASLAALAGNPDPEGETLDSYNNLQVLLGKKDTDREFVVQQNMGGTLSIIKDNYKYIEPGDGPALNPYTNPPIELGNSPQPQLYNLANDPGERENLAKKYPEIMKKMADELQKIKNIKNE